MNTLFNSALKQSSAIKKDLDTFAESPGTSSAALQGQISASLTSFSRILTDYAHAAQSELDPTKKEKAQGRIKSFRADLGSYREQFDALKQQREDAVASTNRSELLGRRPHHAATPENPYAHASSAPVNSPWAPAGGGGGGSSGLSFGAGSSQDIYERENHALREQSFFTTANTQIDEFLDRGRAVLGDLGQQRDILKGTQKRLYSVANTLGISSDTIRMVERRAKQDKWIFWAGLVIFVLFCWLVLHYLT